MTRSEIIKGFAARKNLTSKIDPKLKLRMWLRGWHRLKQILVASTFMLPGGHLASASSEPSQLIEGYDLIMGAQNFEAEATMTSTREDGSNRSYTMKMLKFGDNKFRLYFTKPAAVSGQEILRVDENNWLYLPQLKRTSRISNRDSFQGGDFNNADILRVNYKQDYTAQVLSQSDIVQELKKALLQATGAELKSDGVDSASNLTALELTSKNESSSYDKIHLLLDANSGAPKTARFYGASGKLLRSADYLNYKKLDGKTARPTLIKMKNELIKTRSSEIEYSTFKTDVKFSESKFVSTDLGK